MCGHQTLFKHLLNALKDANVNGYIVNSLILSLIYFGSNIVQFSFFLPDPTSESMKACRMQNTLGPSKIISL